MKDHTMIINGVDISEFFMNDFYRLWKAMKREEDNRKVYILNMEISLGDHPPFNEKERNFIIDGDVKLARASYEQRHPCYSEDQLNRIFK